MLSLKDSYLVLTCGKSWGFFKVKGGLKREKYIYHICVSAGNSKRSMLVAYLLLTYINKLFGAQLLPNHDEVNICLTLLFTLDCQGANLAPCLHCRLRGQEWQNDSQYVQLWEVGLINIVGKGKLDLAWTFVVQKYLGNFGLNWFFFFLELNSIFCNCFCEFITLYLFGISSFTECFWITLNIQLAKESEK